MRDPVVRFITIANEHPLIAAWLGLFFLLVLLLGAMHASRIMGRCFIVFIQEFKHEVSADWDVLRKIARELTRWKSDP